MIRLNLPTYLPTYLPLAWLPQRPENYPLASGLVISLANAVVPESLHVLSKVGSFYYYNNP
jgi:hypothetical protein